MTSTIAPAATPTVPMKGMPVTSRPRLDALFDEIDAFVQAGLRA